MITDRKNLVQKTSIESLLENFLWEEIIAVDVELERLEILLKDLTARRYKLFAISVEAGLEDPRNAGKDKVSVRTHKSYKDGEPVVPEGKNENRWDTFNHITSG